MSPGFSLVETAMALAIIGFACVSLVGLIPIGLTSFHQAIETTTEAEIVQNLSNDILLANFSDLYQYTSQYGNRVYYYDDEGTPLTVVTPGVPPSGTVYKVVVALAVVNNADSLLALYDNGVSIAGKPNASAIPTISSAYNVTMTVTSVNQAVQSHVYTVIVANNNQ